MGIAPNWPQTLLHRRCAGLGCWGYRVQTVAAACVACSFVGVLMKRRMLRAGYLQLLLERRRPVSASTGSKEEGGNALTVDASPSTGERCSSQFHPEHGDAPSTYLINSRRVSSQYFLMGNPGR
ncbi:hypothetical protein K432DRAFT_68009 [Lepidopterella palustris CBS 459.81]|uniref:Uncharacterized protein n=1 Tax=Lepidopterella palustris CBS 459.81 TaxID=1314670 RepID=A0A8E2JJW3_9PEZI|nr:hypothetical protein K432DRAFT_68009 [Lepidopterella palustris CBS 459.81]